MKASDLCKYKNSTFAFETHFKNLFEKLKTAAMQGRSSINLMDTEYYHMTPEQEAYLVSLGYKIEKIPSYYEEPILFFWTKKHSYLEIILSACCEKEAIK